MTVLFNQLRSLSEKLMLTFIYFAIPKHLYESHANHLLRYQKYVITNLSSFLYILIYCIASCHMPYSLFLLSGYIPHNASNLYTVLVYFLVLFSVSLILVKQRSFDTLMIRMTAYKNTTRTLFISQIRMLSHFILTSCILIIFAWNIQDIHTQSAKKIKFNVTKNIIFTTQTKDHITRKIKIQNLTCKGKWCFLYFSFLYDSSKQKYSVNSNTCCVLIKPRKEPIYPGDIFWFKGQVTPLEPTSSDLDFDQYTYAKRRHIYYQAQAHIFLFQRAPWWKRVMPTIRHTLYQQFDPNQQSNAMMIAILLGDTGFIDPHIKKRLMNMGLGHLLAVSGLHVGCFAFLVAYILRYFLFLIRHPRPYLYVELSIIMAAYGFTALAQWPLSAQRASLMLSVLSLSKIFAIRCTLYQSLIITAGILLAYDATYSSELGVQLSFVAVYALITCVESHQIDSIWKIRKKNLITIVIQTSWVASLFTFPIQIWHLGTFNPQSILFNMICTPLFACIVFPLSVCCLILSFIYHGFLEYCCVFYTHIIKILLNLPSYCADVMIVGRWLSIPIGGFCLAYLMWIWAQHYQMNQNVKGYYHRTYLINLYRVPSLSSIQLYHQKLRYTCYLLLVISVGLGTYIYSIKGVRPPFLLALSVGQGDCHLLSNGQGEYALFDVGPPKSGRKITHLLKRLGISKLSWVMISHLHPDHYGGLLNWDKDIHIDHIYYHGRAIKELSDQIASQQKMLIKKIDPTFTQWGDIKLDYVLHDPPQSLKENDASLAILFTVRQQSILLSGDLEKIGEQRLRTAWNARYTQQHLMIWQANHHGSKTSTHRKTLAQLHPRSIVMSMGWWNQFSFPHPRVIKDIKTNHMSIWRTDLQGHIMMEWDHLGIKVSTL